MRHASLILAAAAAAFATASIPERAAAQCATGCSSSAACNGEGRGSCLVICEGGRCTCTDTRCDGQVVPPLGGGAGSALSYGLASRVYRFGAPADRIEVVRAGLLVDCRGWILDVHILDAEGREELANLPVIRLRPSPDSSTTRIAVRTGVRHTPSLPQRLKRSNHQL